MTSQSDEKTFGEFGDTIYQVLMQAHEGLSDAASRRLDTRLVLLLMHEVGDAGRILQLIEEAGAADE